MKSHHIGGIVAIVIVVLCLLGLILYDSFSRWDYIYRDGKYFCQDFKGFHWEECRFSTWMNQRIGPAIVVYALPIALPLGILMYELNVESQLILEAMLIISLILPAALYYLLGVGTALAIEKVQGVANNLKSK